VRPLASYSTKVEIVLADFGPEDEQIAKLEPDPRGRLRFEQFFICAEPLRAEHGYLNGADAESLGSILLMKIGNHHESQSQILTRSQQHLWTGQY